MTGLPRVGFVGLGSQGGPMARRIIDEGFPTTLWARRPESLEPYADTTAVVASSRRELGAACDILCVCVVADADVDSILRGPDGILAGAEPGTVVVIHSTVHPDTCRRLQDDFPRLAVLDAPVSGGGHMAAAQELLVMVGGEADVLARCRPVLDTFANPLLRLGSLGAGQEAKLLNNALFTAHMGLAASAYALGEERGLDLEELAATFSAGSGRSFGAEVIGRAGHGLDVMAQVAGGLLAKDVRLLSELMGPHAADAPLLSAARQALADMKLDL